MNIAVVRPLVDKFYAMKDISISSALYFIVELSGSSDSTT